MDRVPNARIRELLGVTKWVDEMIDESILRWFGHVERIEIDRKFSVMPEGPGAFSLNDFRMFIMDSAENFGCWNSTTCLGMSSLIWSWCHLSISFPRESKVIVWKTSATSTGVCSL